MGGSRLERAGPIRALNSLIERCRVGVAADVVRSVTYLDWKNYLIIPVGWVTARARDAMVQTGHSVTPVW
jgi:hypothetical protein